MGLTLLHFTTIPRVVLFFCKILYLESLVNIRIVDNRSIPYSHSRDLLSFDLYTYVSLPFYIFSSTIPIHTRKCVMRTFLEIVRVLG